MGSKKITVGVMTTDLTGLRKVLSGKQIKYHHCIEIGPLGERYFVVGPMDASHQEQIQGLKFVKDYMLLGSDEINQYFEEHSGNKD